MQIESIMYEITEPMGVSGDEREIREKISKMLPKTYETKTDHIGNLLYNVNEKTKVLFTAHMDEIGLMVSGYTDNHELKFETVGGFDPRTLPNIQVQLTTGCMGVIGTPAPHLVKDRSKVIDMDDLVIDCGFESREEAEENAPIGTTMIVTSHIINRNRKFFSRNTDNRAGCAVLIDIADYCNEEIGLAFLVREEVGLMGMKALMDIHKPEVVINLDVCVSDDLGSGPVINMKDGGYLADRELVDELKDCGIENIEVGKGGTSDHAIGQLFAKTAGISFPSSYIHSSVSCVHLDDLEKASDVCIKYIETRR